MMPWYSVKDAGPGTTASVLVCVKTMLHARVSSVAIAQTVSWNSKTFIHKLHHTFRCFLAGVDARELTHHSALESLFWVSRIQLLSLLT